MDGGYDSLRKECECNVWYINYIYKEDVYKNEYICVENWRF